jgi:hypothetical protein
MKHKRFSDEQVIGVLKEHGEARARHRFERHPERGQGGRHLPAARHQHGNLP